MNSALTIRQPKKYFAQRFALWLSICAMFMAFAGLTSAFIVRRAQSDWLEFSLPPIFLMSTIVIFISSITMVAAHHYYKHDNYNRFRTWLVITFLLGCVFALFQMAGWQALWGNGIFLGGRNANPAGSFVYLLSGGHLLHLAGGLFMMLIAIIRAMYIFNNPAIVLLKDTEPTKGIRMDLLSVYWHFVDVLWIYLYLFLLINK